MSTTRPKGEEDIWVTTDALGEEDMTTHAVGEEDTTMAIGEEDPTTDAIGEEDGPHPIDVDEAFGSF